ncbi:hypothetical protein HHK36_023806 [Tetracentron sinense]|uniref:Rab-GAP TBC domain-containing protein n=2 Tax=Magnoliopsida TaxID=3398 RepID=A0A835D669_TETSI|nr:hypothetical protein HHK36_023806 [Tetracentron sinense]
MWIAGAPTDSFYEVRAECTDVPKTRFKIKAGRTLSARRWQAAFTPEGYLDIAKTLSRIQRGGIHPSIRGEVWEFLLGCYDPKSTFDERDQIRQRRRYLTGSEDSLFDGTVCTAKYHAIWCDTYIFNHDPTISVNMDHSALTFDDTPWVQYAMWKEECRQMDSIVGSGRIITAPLITEDGEPIEDPSVILEANPDKGMTAPQENGDAENLKLFTGNMLHINALDGESLNSSSGSETVRESMSHVLLDKKVIQWKLTLHQIGLDVVRTDRTLVFYEKQEHLSKLWDILAVYAWIDKDVGYCQGMSDLCSPMIILLEDEADAFWCFERLMRRLRGNFRCTESSVGVEAQLSNLASITQLLDPKLHQHLETLGGGDYLFAFRMLMVLFRREFSFGDSLFLWEMMWALEYDPDLFYMYEEPDSANGKSEGSKGKAKSIRQCGKFERENMKNGAKNAEAPLPISLFLVASVLKTKSSKLLQEARGLDDVVKILNDITGNIDAKKACSGAMKLHKKYLKKAKKM